jgi:cell division protein FtsZ
VTIIGRTGVEERKPAPAPSLAMPSISTPPPAAPAPPVEDKVIADSEVASPTTKTQKVKQDFLPLEPIARGRFERSEPTIVEGEDLDVPTFLRLKIKK